MSTHMRTNDPKGVRNRIIDAAYDAFSRRGYNATALLELRESAEVSGGAFSHHFPTKKELGLTIIRDRVAAAVHSAWIEPVRSAHTAYGGIRIAFEDIIAGLDDQGYVSGCPLNNLAMELSSLDAEMRREMDGIFKSWVDSIAGKFEADVRCGVAQDLPAKSMAALVVAIYSGAMAMAKTSQSATPLRHCWDLLNEVLKPYYEVVGSE